MIPTLPDLLTPRWGAVLVLSAGIVLFFTGLGRHRLTAWDESAHTQFASEMVESGDWLSTRVEGKVNIDKPPAVTWVTAALFQLLGETEWVARLPSVFAGLGTLLMLYLLALRLTGSVWAGLMAAAFLAANPVFVQQSRQVSPDGPITFVTALALWRVIRRGAAGAASTWMEAGAAFGLAFMMKQAGAIPAFAGVYAALAVGEVAARGWGWALWRRLGLSLAMAVIIAAPWHLYMAIRYGNWFVQQYQAQVTLRISGYYTAPPHPWFQYYLWLVTLYLFSWLLALWVIPRIWRGAAVPPLVALFGTLAGVLAVYTVAANKIVWYLSPAIPAVAVLAAWGLSRDFEKNQGRASAAAAAAIGAWLFNDRWGWPGVALGFVLLAVLAWLSTRAGRGPAFASAIVVLLLARDGRAVLRQITSREDTDSDRIARLVAPIRAPDWNREPLLVFNQKWRPAGRYYAHRPLLFTHNQECTERFTVLANGGCVDPTMQYYLLRFHDEREATEVLGGSRIGVDGGFELLLVPAKRGPGP